MAGHDEVDVDGLDAAQQARLDALLRAEGIEAAWEGGGLFVPTARARDARRLAAVVRDNRALRTGPDGTRDDSASWGSRVIARIVDSLIVGLPLLVATV